ncbi:hypothetical protein GCM10010297_15600 [Streptomyces malachitofuscus]|nr:hypothetical protein GCM10010297_15600 [Streptomyces malachitofuscus]
MQAFGGAAVAQQRNVRRPVTPDGAPHGLRADGGPAGSAVGADRRGATVADGVPGAGRDAPVGVQALGERAASRWSASPPPGEDAPGAFCAGEHRVRSGIEVSATVAAARRERTGHPFDTRPAGVGTPDRYRAAPHCAPGTSSSSAECVPLRQGLRVATEHTRPAPAAAFPGRPLPHAAERGFRPDGGRADGRVRAHVSGDFP